jgi:hypothetical protein
MSQTDLRLLSGIGAPVPGRAPPAQSPGDGRASGAALMRILKDYSAEN